MAGSGGAVSDTQEKLLTILICTHNRSKLLNSLILSLNVATRPASWDVKILVVANACTDNTHQLLDSCKSLAAVNKSLNLEWIAEPVAGKSHALNSAFPHLATGMVALIDDDQRVSQDFLRKVCRAAEDHPEATLFCGRLLPDWDGTEPRWVRDEGAYKVYPPPIPSYEIGAIAHFVLDSETMPPGGNLVVRSDVFRRVGEFSTDLGPHGHDLGGGEDTAYIRKALAQGERLYYDPDIIQYHYVDPLRLKLSFLMRLAFHRTYAAVRLGPATGGMPAYVWRKLATYGIKALFSARLGRRRFFLVRVAAALGEIKGLYEINTKAKRHRPDMQGDRFPLLSRLAIPVALGCLSMLWAKPLLSTSITVAASIAGICAAGLILKSALSFSRTGPQLKAEIQRYYSRYSLYAVFRLGVWAFVLCMLMALAGVVFYGSLASALGFSIDRGIAVIFGLLGLALITSLQFCRHLLCIPASIEASSNYRMSRLYALWGALTPERIEGAILSLALLFAVAAIMGGTRLSMQGQGENAIGLLAAAMAFVIPAIQARKRVEPWPVRSRRANSQPNILMIGCDSLRADRVASGHPRNLTPFIDQLAMRGARFTNCFVPCARTAPSLASMLTGSWPQRHGIRDNFVAASECGMNSVPSMADTLNRAGYRTTAISDWCGADLGKLEFGFENCNLPEDQWNIKYLLRQGPKDIRLFLSLFSHNKFGQQFLPELYYLAGVPTTALLGRDTRAEISQAAGDDKPFFINVFMSTTHGPFGSEYPYYTLFPGASYNGDSKFVMSGLNEPFEVVKRQGHTKDKFDLAQIVDLYDGCVRNFDDEVKKIVDHVRQCGLEDNTIIVIYSDHGMEFFERETWGQGNSVIVDDSARIPLIIVDPRGARNLVVAETTRAIDLAPTLLDLSGHGSADQGFDGVSLAGVIRGETAMPELNAYYETGIWFTKIPGLGDDHLHYPDLPDLLEVQNKQAATIGIKPALRDRIIAAKDRALRVGEWKLVRLALQDGPKWLLFDVSRDPDCRHDVGDAHPEVVEALRERGSDLWLN
ncbi:MAG: arylsulfatase [Nitrosomonadales bacterium]|nr:MAG: arylsulfatase [Nitrosomonadales bacterium]